MLQCVHVNKIHSYKSIKKGYKPSTASHSTRWLRHYDNEYKYRNRDKETNKVIKEQERKDWQSFQQSIAQQKAHKELKSKNSKQRILKSKKRRTKSLNKEAIEKNFIGPLFRHRTSILSHVPSLRSPIEYGKKFIPKRQVYSEL